MGMLLVAYPFVVYIGLQYLPPRWLSIALLALISLRLFLSKPLLAKMPWLPVAFALGAMVLLMSAFANNELGILLYPVAVNIAMMLAFAYSLINKPSIIETFARIKEPELSDKAVKYTENVTKVWCAFFALNAAVSLYSALCLSKQAWILYNGLISYILVALLFAIEWLVRQKIKHS